MVGVEEVADRNGLQLYKTSRPGQWKAHCPICQDGPRKYHLYASSVKDTFCCHKCGARGGAVHFHAWLRGISFEEAKAELYPNTREKKYTHPAERLTKEQLDELGYTLRKPNFKAPNGVDKDAWRKHRKAELDWIWHEWQEHERAKRAQMRRLTALLSGAGEGKAI